MKVYVINLKRSSDRRSYMERLLKQYTFLDVEFIEAIDGRYLSAFDKNRMFDIEKANSLYGRYLSDGEIGCTLSHQLCYEKLINDKEDFALVLEDDLFISADHVETILKNLEDVLINYCDIPIVLLLSGDYWWTKVDRKLGRYSLVSVYDASCAQSYIINKNAAFRMKNDYPFFLADDWLYYKKKVKIMALFPHLMDQNRVDFSTQVIANNIGIVRKNLSFNRNIFYYGNAIIKKLLYKFNRFEGKNFKGGVE